MSNIILGFFGFALFLFVIGPENSRHFLNQSDAKPKPIATWLLASSRALVTCVFPRFDYMRFPALWLACLWVLRGSFPCFWLAIGITVVLVWRHSIEKSSFIKAHCHFTTCNRCLKYRARNLHIKLCLLLWFKFFKTMILLLSRLRDFSVRFREIILESNRIQSANCHWWHFFPKVAYFGNQRQTTKGVGQ